MKNIYRKKNWINDIFNFSRIDAMRKSKTNFRDVCEIKIIFFSLFFFEIWVTNNFAFDVFIFFCSENFYFEKKFELIEMILKEFKIDKNILFARDKRTTLKKN